VTVTKGKAEMSSIVRLLLTTAFATSVVVMIPCSSAFADDPAGVAHEQPAASGTVGLAGLPQPATEIISGVVAGVDERSDTIRIQRSPERAEELKVQDGLLFSAVRYGDQVEVTVQNINGTKTIVALVKR
jgi:hypothetical protein